jgi:hypothetical protein
VRSLCSVKPLSVEGETSYTAGALNKSARWILPNEARAGKWTSKLFPRFNMTAQWIAFFLGHGLKPVFYFVCRKRECPPYAPFKKFLFEESFNCALSSSFDYL